MSETIDTKLVERGKRYGAFIEHAKITQKIKTALRETPNWDKLEQDQKEALEMLAHKMGRILNGDHNYMDSWEDCIGYLKVTVDRMLKDGCQ